MDDFLLRLPLASALLQQAPLLTYHYNARELVFCYDKLKLYHYHPRKKKTKKAKQNIPTLVVFATVNRPEILDLFPERSLIGGLLQQELDVYLLDWGYPTDEDKHISFADYIEYLRITIDALRDYSGSKKINLLGVCQGGLISLCYATLYRTLQNLILISTPVDFHTKDNLIGQFMQGLDLTALQKNNHNIAGDLLTQFFIYLRPFELIGKKYLRYVDNIFDETATKNFLQVEKWLHDAPDQTLQSFYDFIHYFYKKNLLMQEKLILNKKKIDLKKVKVPVLNIMASSDEIIPPSASSALKEKIGTKNYEELMFPSGHIGIYVSEKVGKALPLAIGLWLQKNADKKPRRKK